MNPIPFEIADLIKTAIQSAQEADDLPEFDMPQIPVIPSKSPAQGDYGSPVALASAKLARRKPLDIAQAIADHMPKADFIGAVEVAPPGYVNIRLDAGWLHQQIDATIDAGETFAKLNLHEGKTAQVEYLSANPTGPITIGRTRGAILGEGIARLLEAVGYEVTREYYFNNAGGQMRRLGESLRIRYLQALGQSIDLPEDHYQGDYLVEFAKALAAEKGDSLKDADWQPFKEYAEARIFEWIRQTLDRVNIQHDVFFNEITLIENGHVEDALKRLDEAGYIYRSPVREQEDDEVKELNKDLPPATWFRSTKMGDDEDRVVVRSNDEPTYTLPDIAYHINKVERDFDLLVNVLGADHKKEAEVVRLGLEALGYRTDHLHVVFMQMVHLRRGGEEMKMSTRKADYITLDEMIDMTSADAIQYFMLHRSPESQFTFDADLAVQQSNENPVYYIQYAHVRCLGIFREAQARAFDDAGADLRLLDDEAMDFVRLCLKLPETVAFAADNLSPHTIAHFALDLANQFHPMYDRVRVFGEGIDPAVAKARLRFYKMAAVTLKRVLALMGMSAPERM